MINNDQSPRASKSIQWFKSYGNFTEGWIGHIGGASAGEGLPCSLRTRGGRDQFFENKAIQGEFLVRNGKRYRIRGEFSARNGKRYGIRGEFSARKGKDTIQDTSFFNENREKQGKNWKNRGKNTKKQEKNREKTENYKKYRNKI